MQREWLTALRAPGLAGRRLVDLIEVTGGIEALVGASVARLRGLGLGEETIAALRSPDEETLSRDLEWLSGEGRFLVTIDSERYPALLRRIAAPPPALFVEGQPDLLWMPQVAVVGSRNPTAGGMDHARAFSAELSRQGMAITSGLAAGVDSAAHAAALDAGGTTFAVAGTGLDQVYPASSRGLAERIRVEGALVSELPPGTPPRRAHFPARNRIISGLALGVLVVEAGVNSGSLITARHATEQGREVFALPGSLHNPMAKGCHRLIREGARLVETCADIMDELGPLAGELAVELRRQLADGAGEATPDSGAEASGEDPLLQDPDYRALWDALGYDPVPVDQLVRRCGLRAQEVSSMLLVLELQDRVEAHAGGRYCRRS